MPVRHLAYESPKQISETKQKTMRVQKNTKEKEI
jgi:hypothetical protein